MTRALLRLAAALLGVVSLAAQPLPADLASVAPLIAGHRTQRENITIGTRTIDITLTVPADASADATAALLLATRTALVRLETWLGPLSVPALTVIDVPWHRAVAGASYPGLVITSTRWLSTSRDPASERPLLAALARQYTFSIAAPGDADGVFEEGLALYLGRRLIHQQLHQRNFETPRFFGGFIPFSIRSVLNSERPEDPRPHLEHLADVEMPPDAPWRAASAAISAPAQRMAAALQTFERHVGWPAFQQVLEHFMARFRGRAATTADLMAVASEVIGRDLSSFFEQGTLDPEFDYAIVDLRNGVGDGGFTTTVVVRRTGRPLSLGVPLLVRFEDGAEVTEQVDGGDVEQAYVYRGPARAVLASVDPDAVLVIDTNRENNTRVIGAPTNWIGVRLALNWITWLQDAMLAYTALL
ncbi:MAG TPA: hypothetical protein VJ691_02710 [Vicinamibacterales bacterium]|nr:hypothetical protein [Vicinamibacterales bacterium]